MRSEAIFIQSLLCHSRHCRRPSLDFAIFRFTFPSELRSWIVILRWRYSVVTLSCLDPFLWRMDWDDVIRWDAHVRIRSESSGLFDTKTDLDLWWINRTLLTLSTLEEKSGVSQLKHWSRKQIWNSSAEKTHSDIFPTILKSAASQIYAKHHSKFNANGESAQNLIHLISVGCKL